MIGGYEYITASTILPMLTHKFIHLKKTLAYCDVKFKEIFAADLISRIGNAYDKWLP